MKVLFNHWRKAVFTSFFAGFFGHAESQMITGTWKGKINHQKVELKIILKGDSLVGTSYYYESPTNYRRYSIRGYFDEKTNAAVWWDDELIDEKSGRFTVSTPGKIPMLSRADFNCPGSGKMMLDGKAARREEELLIKGDVHLDKTENPVFEDEWDFVIDNYIIGANDPDIIDSISAIAFKPVEIPEPPAVIKNEEEPKIETPKRNDIPVNTAKRIPSREPVTPAVTAPVIKNIPIEEKFAKRERVFMKEIPVEGDSIELRFYDNAEIDGDSISLFLNEKMIRQHIRLTGNAWILKLAVADLEDGNELTMVAENLGSIPPNTPYMVAVVNEKRYEAFLASTEGSSAMIRFRKK